MRGYQREGSWSRLHWENAVISLHDTGRFDIQVFGDKAFHVGIDLSTGDDLDVKELVGRLQAVADTIKDRSR